jgi:Flp pilus assembly protein TadD
MRSAADLEASSEKHPVTPGEVLPAAEMLGDMLLESAQHKEALVQYRVALNRSPNRFNSLYGAARTSEQMGDDAEARRHYQQLVEVTAATAERHRLQRARAFLEGV